MARHRVVTIMGVPELSADRQLDPIRLIWDVVSPIGHLPPRPAGALGGAGT